MKCTYCEAKISETAKKCKYCGEWVKKDGLIIDRGNTDYINNKKGTNKPKSRMTKFKEEYWIYACILGLLIAQPIYNNFSNQIPNGNNSIDQNSSITYTSNHNDESENNSIGTDNSETKTYKLTPKGNSNNIKATENGYILFPNTENEFKIEGDDEILNFVDAIGKADKGEPIKFKNKVGKKTFKNNGINATIYIDNSYSTDSDGNVDKEGPEKRIDTLGKYLTRENFPNGSNIFVSFLYSKKSEVNSEEPDSNGYNFKIDPSVFEFNYINEGEGEPFYDNKRHNLIYRDVNLVRTLSGDEKCKTATDGFTCLDAESTFNKIKEIFNDKYNKEIKHTNNLFIKTLIADKDFIYNDDKDSLWLFTDGEFEAGFEIEDSYLKELKNKYIKILGHDLGADKAHNLSDFTMRNANRYQRDGKYRNFWKEATNIVKEKIPECNNLEINIIGLKRSAEFNSLAKEVYKDLFNPCNVNFYY